MQLFLWWKEEYKQYGKTMISSNMSNTSVRKKISDDYSIEEQHRNAGLKSENLIYKLRNKQIT